MSESAPAPEPSGLDVYRPLMLALVGLAIVLGLARSAGPGPLSATLAVALLAGVPLVGAQLGAGSRAFFVLAALGVWLVFQPQEAGLAAVPGLVLHRLAYFALPPLVLSLALADHDRERLKLGWAHLYGPAMVMGLGAIVHLFVRWNDPGSEREIRTAAMVYAGCYALLIAIGLLMRMRAPEAEGPRPVSIDRASELEEQGRFAMAAQVYERNGQLEQAAQAAEKAGDWARAARLYRRAGDDFNAGEMYYRARMLPEALDAYERANAVPAAARLCAQLGQVDRAVEILERAGYAKGIVETLEAAGRTPTPEQYRRAGMLDRAAQAYEAARDWQRAADIYEHELEDQERAAALHLQAGSFAHAGRLLEAMGRKQEALEAYAASPDGAVDAARLLLAAGRTQQAADVLARLPAAKLDSLQDETTLTLVARVMLETERVDEAARILQGLKRKGASAGAVRLLLGRTFRLKGLHDLAEEELRVAVSQPMEPEDEIAAAYLLGCVLEETRKYEEAAQVFHGVLQKDLEYADVQERYRRVKQLSSSA